MCDANWLSWEFWDPIHTGLDQNCGMLAPGVRGVMDDSNEGPFRCGGVGVVLLGVSGGMQEVLHPLLGKQSTAQLHGAVDSHSLCV